MHIPYLATCHDFCKKIFGYIRYFCTHISVLILSMFFIDLMQFLYSSTIFVYMSIALYSVLLIHASFFMLVFQSVWIGISSLYTHGFMFLHLLTLIPLSFIVHWSKHFFNTTLLLPFSFIILFFIGDSFVFWLVGLPIPLKDFTILKIILTLIGGWLFFLKYILTGERDNRTSSIVRKVRTPYEHNAFGGLNQQREP